jgi:hypothetical protein
VACIESAWGALMDRLGYELGSDRSSSEQPVVSATADVPPSNQ